MICVSWKFLEFIERQESIFESPDLPTWKNIEPCHKFALNFYGLPVYFLNLVLLNDYALFFRVDKDNAV